MIYAIIGAEVLAGYWFAFALCRISAQAERDAERKYADWLAKKNHPNKEDK
jgi:hypothetical protein